MGQRHHRGREVPRFVGRLVHVVLQVFVVAEEALVILGDVSVGRQFDFEIADGLEVGANVEVLAVRFRVLVVQIGLLNKPAIGRGLLGEDPVTKSIAVHVGVWWPTKNGNPGAAKF